jgi:DNA-binding transcriptional ArsR family regulator
LTADTGVTRQAVTRHLDVLRDAGLVRGTKIGREHLWQLEAARLELARRSLDQLSGWWDEKLAALKAALEEGDHH